VPVVPFDDHEETEAALLDVFPPELTTKIMQYHHEWCHVLVIKRLIVSGWMSTAAPRYHHAITTSAFEAILKTHMRLDYSIMNGPEVKQYRARESPERGEICLYIKDENVTLCDSTVSTSWQRGRSSWVHGVVPVYTRGMEYVKTLEILLDYFSHTGEMKTEIVPAKANLNRTQYEVLMILVKQYAQELIGKSVYWKVDKKRNNAVKDIRENFVEPLRKAMKVTSNIRLPAVQIRPKIVFSEDVLRLVPDETEERRAKEIAKFESKMMASEDFDAGNAKQQASIHTLVEKGHTSTIEEPDVLVRVGNNVVIDRPRLPKQKQWRFIPRGTVITTSPTEEYERYVAPKAHGIDTSSGLKEVVEKKVVSISRWTDDIQIDRQAKWQETANINMAAVLKGAFIYNLQEVEARRKWKNKAMGQRYRIRLKKGARKEYLDKVSQSYFTHLGPKSKKASSLMAKGIEYKKQVNQAGLRQLQNKINIRSLFYSMFVMGQHKAVAQMNYRDMVTLLICHKQNRKFTPVRNKRTVVDGKLVLKKCRVTKYDLIILRNTLTVFSS